MRCSSIAVGLAGLMLTHPVLTGGAVVAQTSAAGLFPRQEVHVPAQIRIPESLRIEHEEIHAELVRATKAPGAVGEAARELAAVLHPHFVREEEIALPPLGLLEPLARGELTPDMREVLPMTDSLRAELPRMLEEHRAIRAATMRLGDVARAEGNEPVAQLASKLALHAQGEEELFYPAAVLVGDLVRSRMQATSPE